MSWRITQAAYRARMLARIDTAEAERYDAAVAQLSAHDQAAYSQDLVELPVGAGVLDVGAGTGALCSIFVQRRGLQLTVLEPSPTSRLRGRNGSCRSA
ncbi:MAG: hypothetical protein JST54_07295 [Deltaproteobacteria bacterium]|nr:hypothetical protein [Deltaproteobacteria bacterium]